jgi:transcriptional regulator with XRE-family HTH domain
LPIGSTPSISPKLKIEESDMPTRPWRAIRRPLSPEREAKIQARIEAEIARMKLPELRKARALTQQSVADVLGIAQGDVSKLERRTDTYVGTLRSYIEALGGKLRIVAEFPGSAPIEIQGFSALDSPPAAPSAVRRIATVQKARRRPSIKRRAQQK